MGTKAHDLFVLPLCRKHHDELHADNHPQKTQMPSMNEAVKQIEQEVLTTWPTQAISHAQNVVYRLSGMYEFVVNDAPEQTEDAGPAEPVSAGKCSTVS